ncbi:MAG: EAL domain-containing protein [Bacillaceae bacterium]
MVNNKEQLALLNSLSDLVFIVKYEHNNFYITFVNDTLIKNAGNKMKLVGRTLEEILDKQYAKQVVKYYYKVVETKKHLTYEAMVPEKNKRIIYGKVTLSPIFNADGDVEKIIGITSDITDAYLEKKEILEQQLRYKSLFDHNMDGIIKLDINGTILGVNKMIQSILCYEESELLHNSILDLIGIKSIKAFYSIISPTLLGNCSESSKCDMLHKDGNYISVYFKTVPIVVNESVKGMFLIVRDITEKTQSEEKIRFLAGHDHLTGLFNRQSLLEHIEQCISKYHSQHTEFAILIIDIDRFKVLNATFGYSAGDEALNEFTNRLKAFTRKGIQAYRIGGGEFALLIDPCNQRNAANIAQKVLESVSKPLLLNHSEYYMTCTIGIGMYPVDGRDKKLLIQNATAALHSRKERSRGAYQFYNPDIHQFNPKIIGLETQLRKALSNNELVVYYQPQINIDKNKIYGVEALVRWNSHDYGLVPPNEFLPIAEETGIILQIGEWVIGEVCRQLRKWLDKGYDPLPIGINLSPKQFLSPTLFETVQSALLTNRLHPSLITIEITESAMLDPVRTMEVLKQLKDIGVYISVDDFGTGFSSLNYLKNFPIDILKIDRSFINEITSSGKDAAITTALIQLAQLLQLDVVAAGVETKEQVDFLHAKNCMHAQGYFYSEAIPKEQFEQKYLVKKE